MQTTIAAIHVIRTATRPAMTPDALFTMTAVSRNTEFSVWGILCPRLRGNALPRKRLRLNTVPQPDLEGEDGVKGGTEKDRPRKG